MVAWEEAGKYENEDKVMEAWTTGRGARRAQGVHARLGIMIVAFDMRR
jgi:hypothetical protein